MRYSQLISQRYCARMIVPLVNVKDKYLWIETLPIGVSDRYKKNSSDIKGIRKTLSHHVDDTIMVITETFLVRKWTGTLHVLVGTFDGGIFIIPEIPDWMIPSRSLNHPWFWENMTFKVIPWGGTKRWYAHIKTISGHIYFQGKRLSDEVAPPVKNRHNSETTF